MKSFHSPKISSTFSDIDEYMEIKLFLTISFTMHFKHSDCSTCTFFLSQAVCLVPLFSEISLGTYFSVNTVCKIRNQTVRKHKMIQFKYLIVNTRMINFIKLFNPAIWELNEMQFVFTMPSECSKVVQVMSDVMM